MRTRKRGSLAIAGLAALALGAAACSSSSSTASGGGSSSPAALSLTSGLQGLNPGTGTPQKGGTLNMLGTGDVDYMDPNISYYGIGYLGLRMWTRSLYANPATPGQVTSLVPDLATAIPKVSNGGKTYSVTIRSGAMWNTTPARQVTGADALLGLKRACNPAQPWGGLPDFESLLVGYQSFCNGFANVKPDVADMKNYIDSHNISGVKVSGQTITYTLTSPASWFAAVLSLPPFNPAPAEFLNYIPGGADLAQHTISDGPYEIKSYVPTKSITFVRNPAWKASTDPVRKAYVDTINVNETGDQTTIQQELETNTLTASMEFDSFPPVASITGLLQQMMAGTTKNMNLGPSFSSNPYVIFNTVSPNNGGALGKLAVRQAISYAISRAHLIQDDNGPQVSPPLTHILPDGINGSQGVPKGFEPFPYNVAKAKSMLAAAGYPNGLTINFLYRPASSLSSKMFQTLQADLALAGIKVVVVAVPSADFYTKYLQVPDVAHRGVWDMSLAGWAPDWYGDAAVSFFKPLFYGATAYPPVGSNFGFYNDPAVNAEIQKASTTADASAAAALWAKVDQQVTKDAAIFPITQNMQPDYHASYVHNAVYIPTFEQFDPTNVWLSTP